MKKTVPYLILFVLALLIWNGLFDHGMSIDIDGEDFNGPLGGIAAVLFASGGILIGIVVAIFVAAILALVFAGVGVVVIVALVLAALVTALAISPLLLPVLIPVAIIWLIAGRNRRRHDDVKSQPV
jgi:hypothetical protein